MNADEHSSRRDQFLLEMYRQVSNHLERHILVIWQSTGLLIGALALLALVEKQVITIDAAAGAIVLICAWASFHVSDASLWFNRNMLLITNVERQFLSAGDVREIHCYFKRQRPGAMVSHLRIQLALAICLGLLILVFHFITRVVPGFNLPLTWQSIDVVRFPYAVAAIASGCWIRFHQQNRRKYEKLLEASPGREFGSLTERQVCESGESG